MPVTIPDTPDYGTPVPRATTGVQSYGVTQPVQQDVAAWTYAANSAKAAADSDAAVMKETAAAVDKFSLSIDTTQAQDALNQLRGRRQELTSGESGYMRVEGGNVLKKGPDGQTIYETFPQKLQTGVDEIGGNLQSPRARKLFREAAANELLAYKSEVARHGLNQTEKYQGAVFKDALTTLSDRAIGLIASGDPKQIEAAEASIRGLVRSRGEQLGVPTEAMEKAALSDVYKVVIEKAIVSGDTSAIGLFERYKDKIDAKDQLALEQATKTMSIGAIAQDFARNPPRAGTGAAEGVKTSMTHWTGAGYSAQQAAGMTAGFLRESQFSTGARNRGDGRDGSDSINIGQWNAARATAFLDYARKNGLNPNSVQTGLKYAKAEIDGEVPYSISGLSPDFKARLQNAKSEKEAADIMTRGYFRPKHTEGESKIRQESATVILTQHSGASPSASTEDSRIGDPLATSVNDATAGKAGVRTLENVVNVFTSPTLQKATETADGVPNARQQLIEIEKAKIQAMEANAARWSGNPAQYAANNAAINTLYEQRKAAVTLYKDQLWNAVQEHMTKGGPNGGPAITMPSADIISQLDRNQVEMLEKQVTRAIAGAKPTTDWALFTELERDLTSSDANVRAAAAKLHPYQFRDRLADDQYKRLLELQAAVNKGSGKEFTELTTPLQKMNAKLEELDINPNPKPGTTDAKKVVQFREVFQEHLAALEARKGSKADPKEIDEVLKGVTRDVVVKGWFTNSKKPLALLDRKDIPPAEWQEMVNTFHQLGAPPSESDVLRAIILKRARKPVEAMPPAAMPSRFPAPVALPGEMGTGSALPAAPPGPVTTVRERYQRAMSVPSKDLVTLGADALRWATEK